MIGLTIHKDRPDFTWDQEVQITCTENAIKKTTDYNMTVEEINATMCHFWEIHMKWNRFCAYSGLGVMSSQMTNCRFHCMY